MGTTPKGYPYPEGTDLVVDGDDAIQALAEAVDTRLVYAITAGSNQVTGAKPGTAATTTVTLPADLFTQAPIITLGAYTSIPAERFVSHINKTATSFQLKLGYTGQSESASAYISWHAVQVAAGSAAVQAGSGQQLAESPSDATATCTTFGCQNEGIPIEVSTHWVDEETGESKPVDAVQCGVCGADITATEEATS